MRVLFLTHRLPYAPNRGDRLRAFHILRLLAARGVQVELVSLVHDRAEQDRAPAMLRPGLRVTPLLVPYGRNLVRAAGALHGSRPLTHTLLDSPEIVPLLNRIVEARPPDVVLAYCSGMARFAMQPPLVDCPLVLDLVDVDSRKWAILAEQAAWPRRAVYEREARRLACFEQLVATAAFATVVVNEREKRALEQLAPEANVRIVSNGLDRAALRPRFSRSGAPHVVFCGVMNYAPNVEGILWFVRQVWPLVRMQRPDARFSIVGSDPVPAIRRLDSALDGIEVTGGVGDVRSYLWKAAISVAPLAIARGMQNKVLEALAAGLPTVVTGAVLDGLPLEARAGCRVANAADEFAGQVLALLALSNAERSAIVAQADVARLGWEQQLSPMYDILVAAARQRGLAGRQSTMEVLRAPLRAPSDRVVSDVGVRSV